jgi:hypothetical protein
MAEPEYDIFEKLPDGGEVWRDVGVGLDDLRVKLEQLGEQSPNVFFATRTRTKRVNESKSAAR